MALLKKKKEMQIPEPDKEGEKKEDDTMWAVGEVATQTERVFYNKKTEEQLDIHGMLCSIKNDLEDIKEFLQK